MTTHFTSTAICAYCGESGDQTSLTSTSSFGSPDLDTRPPQMERWSLGLRMNRCKSCGYCAPDISEKTGSIAQLIQSDGYQTQLVNHDLPDLSNSFICYALIQEKVDRLSQVGWAYLYAAWICDDEKNQKGSIECRKNALNTFQKARIKGQEFVKDTDTEDIILIDLCRRTKQFNLAVELCNKLIMKGPSKSILPIAHFQKYLISNEDTKCYTMAEEQRADEKRTYEKIPYVVNPVRLACPEPEEPEEPEEPVKVDQKCPKCGSEMIIKNYGKYGQYLECRKYPKCRGKLNKFFFTGKKCIEKGCKGELVELQLFSGVVELEFFSKDVYFGCNKWPDCNFVTWDEPLEGPCPDCEAPTLFLRRSKKYVLLSGDKTYCGVCKFSRTAES